MPMRMFLARTTTENVGILAREFPHTTIILGHMGLALADDEAIQAAAQNDNLFLETSVGAYLMVKEALRRLGSSKIFASEFYHPQVELEKIRVLLKGGDFEQVTSKNILAMLAS